MASGWIKGFKDVYVRVYQEKSDDTKGNLLLPESWLAEDEYVKLNGVERQRIIYDYKYSEDDEWNVPSTHAYCYEDRENATSMP